MAVKQRNRDFCVMLNIGLITNGNNKILCVREIF